MRKHIIQTLILFAFAFPATAGAQSAEAADGKAGTINIQEIIFGHTDDAYEWHIANFGHTHISIPLPVILWDETKGWNVFLSSQFEKNNGEYNGFYISTSPENKGKIVKRDGGKEVRPVNISITKNVLELFIVMALMLSVFLWCARWYKDKKPQDDAPKGFVGFIELFVMSINDDVIKSSIGEKHYRFYAPYLLTAFFFIFMNNVIGLIPIFPGGANLTGNIAITLILALCTFIAVNVFGNKHYWKDIFWPEVPTWLKFPVPMMPVVEFFGVLTKPFALMIRLFANILAGHAIVISLVCIIFITFQMGVVIGTSLTVVSVIMTIFMDFLELLVAFIQAYVFTMLSAVFIGLAHLEPETK